MAIRVFRASHEGCQDVSAMTLRACTLKRDLIFLCRGCCKGEWRSGSKITAAMPWVCGENCGNLFPPPGRGHPGSTTWQQQEEASSRPLSALLPIREGVQRPIGAGSLKVSPTVPYPQAVKSVASILSRVAI